MRSKFPLKFPHPLTNTLVTLLLIYNGFMQLVQGKSTVWEGLLII